MPRPFFSPLTGSTLRLTIDSWALLRALPWVTVRSRTRRSAGSIASRGGFTEGWEHMRVDIPVSLGELVDKITILQIKSTRLVEPDAKANVRRELEAWSWF